MIRGQILRLFAGEAKEACGAISTQACWFMNLSVRCCSSRSAEPPSEGTTSQQNIAPQTEENPDHNVPQQLHIVKEEDMVAQLVAKCESQEARILTHMAENDGDESVMHGRGPLGERRSLLDMELLSAVNDQYREFGITVQDLKTYLDVAVDIEDSISVGRMPKLEPERYKVYKRVNKLIRYGPDKTQEEEERLHEMAETEMLSLPWPSTMIRNYLKAKGEKVVPLNKAPQTKYDQGWMTNALISWESDQEMWSASSGTPHRDVISSFWEDELEDDNETINRKARRGAGTEDVSDWACAVARAIVQSDVQPSDPSASPHSDSSSEGAALAEVSTGEDAGGEEEPQDTLQALLEARMQSMPEEAKSPERRKEANKAAARAVLDAAFQEQEASILRSHGYSGDAEGRAAMLQELDMTERDWLKWVDHELQKRLEHLSKPTLDYRSPADMIEDLVEVDRAILPHDGPVYDLTKMVEEHPFGPVSDYHIYPSHMHEGAEKKHPAAEADFMKSIIEASEQDYIFPEIFNFKQRIVFHVGEQPYHPANRRISLRVHIDDMRERYKLTDQAVEYIVLVCGKRYNPKTGMVKISCGKHRARDENKRQAMHWVIRLVETAMKTYPSDEWEQQKKLQLAAIKEASEPFPCVISPSTTKPLGLDASS